MFEFDLSTLDGDDIRYTIEALHLILTAVHGQHNNLGLQYMLGILSDESERREEGRPAVNGPTEFVIPIDEMTPAHLWMLTRFCCGTVQAAVQGESSTMTLLFARVVDQIELHAKRVKATVSN